ncbi:gamma-interferon-inducible lysosomal thiol reductase-like [Amblyomma americanum]
MTSSLRAIAVACLALVCSFVLSAGTPTASSSGGRPPNRVKVQLFYETHCPYSQKFITHQLWPTYLRLNGLLNVRLIPFGMAKRKETVGKGGRMVTEITCQHGRRECVGNMIQACAVSLFKGTYKLLAFVVCMESSATPHKAARACASRVGVDWAALRRCTSSKTGPRLLLKMGRKTASHQPAIRHVPYVVVNGKQGQDIENRARTDLYGLVCSMFAEPVPAACLSKDATKTVATTDLLMLNDVAANASSTSKNTPKRT